MQAAEARGLAKGQRLNEAEVAQGGHMMIRGGRRETAKSNPREAAAWPGRKLRRHRPDGDARSTIRRKAIDAGRYRRESQRSQPMRRGEVERGAIARRQEFVLTFAAAAPYRADGVNHILGRKPITAGHLGATGLAAAKRAAFRQQLRPGGAMDGAVDAAAPQQRSVRRIDDGVERKRCDIGDADVQARGADIGG